MKIGELIRELRSWKDFEECDLKVRINVKDFERNKIAGMVPNLFMTIK